MIAVVTNRTTRKGDPMAILEFEDLEGSIEVVVFPEAYKKAGELFEGRIVWIEGTVRINHNGSKNRNSDDETEVEERQIQANEIVDLETVPEQQTSAVEVIIRESDLDNLNKLKTLKEIALANKGDLHLILRLMSPRFGEVIARCGLNYKITDNDSVFKQVENLFGENCIKRSNRTKPKNGNRSTRNGYV